MKNNNKNSSVRSYVSMGVVLLLTVSCLPVRAGLVVYGTRFVVTEEAPALGITVKNTGDSSVLVHSLVGAEDGGSENTKNVPFVITPPLFSLSPGRSNVLRLICPDCSRLPKERESAFLLSIAEIPSGIAGSDTVQLAVRSHFKLFWRPTGLLGEPESAYKQLRWQREDKYVSVHNPTPYFVTLFKVIVNGRKQPIAGMVPPFGKRRFQWCQSGTTSACDIQWKSLDDYATEQPAWRVIPERGMTVGHPAALSPAIP
jgi:P pilus assembly chaperone PapD